MAETPAISRTEVLNQRKREFRAFIEADLNGAGPYTQKISAMVRRGEQRLIIDLAHLRAWDPNFARRLLLEPEDYLPGLETALTDYVHAELADEVADADKQAQQALTLPQLAPRHAKYSIGLEGSFGAQLVSPRQLAARFLRQLVCVEGIVTRCSVVRPKLVTSAHFCPATSVLEYQAYRDPASLDRAATGETGGLSAYRTHDAQGHVLQTEYGLCEFRDSQVLVLQEMPERAPPGLLPRSVEVLLDGDLVDRVKPGDRVRIAGVYRPLAHTAGGTGASAAAASFRSVLVANHAQPLVGRELGALLADADIANIRAALATHGDSLFERLAASLAPSICGHTHIKQALLLQLLGGEEHNLATGTHLRGDINVLLVGDPSTAKSQLLRFVLHIAPLAVSTNGRGASGVGLTAAVTTDRDTGERRLEAGAMVLADRGVVCIDEFDKMSEDDRVAIHEVMEQQTVTINKAGIHASLNARCSVLAAANPLYGKYNRAKRPHENIALPDSLLSRFDLLFIVLDHVAPDRDRRVAEHVLRMHRFRPAHEQPTAVADANAAASMHALAANPDAPAADAPADPTAPAATPVYVKFDALLHGGAASDARRPGEAHELFSIGFIRKFLLYARTRCHPRLSDEAAALLSDAYSALRSKTDLKTLPATPRMLETLIRLSTAHAKCFLRDDVSLADAQAALRIVNFALYQDANAADPLLDGNPAPAPADTTQPDDSASANTSQPSSSQPSSSHASSTSKRKRGEGDSSAGVEAERVALVMAALVRLRRTAKGPLTLEALAAHLNRTPTAAPVFAADELSRIAVHLASHGKIRWHNNKISFTT